MARRFHQNTVDSGSIKGLGSLRFNLYTERDFDEKVTNERGKEREGGKCCAQTFETERRGGGRGFGAAVTTVLDSVVGAVIHYLTVSRPR